jgi:predicted enzyme related to lactoylglutathione lyase
MGTTPTPQDPGVHFEGSVPILRVRDLEASLDHYGRVLGFTMDWHEPGVMASVSRGRACLMLCHGAQGNPGTWVWIGVSDAAALFEEYAGGGATIRMTPRNFPWAYEMHVEDPDRHVLRFGSEPLAGQPFGEWPA